MPLQSLTLWTHCLCNRCMVSSEWGEVVDVFLLPEVANVELHRLTNEVTLGGSVG